MPCLCFTRTPAASNITFEEHAARLFKSWVLNWLAKYKMLKEVHLLFDEFDKTVTPKIFERTRRTNVTCNGEEIQYKSRLSS